MHRGDPAGGNRVRTWIARALLATGAVCLGSYGVLTLQAAVYQHRAKAQIAAMARASAAKPGSATLAAPRTGSTLAAPPPIKRGAIIGRVDVPRLALSAAVAEGDEESVLGKAVGHLPDTPLPWQPGNVAFAAHRDTLFRPLRNIRLGDDITVVTARGRFAYRVTRTRIVNPDDVWVIAPTAKPTLTLITCYPFYFVGHAPKRFIVQAERLDEAGAAALAEPAGVPLTGSVVE